MATTTLGNKSTGSIIKLKENGTLVDFYVAKHDYESGLNGAGRTLVVRKDCYDNRVWDNGNVNAYASSDLDSWFNSTYKNMLDADIRSLIGTTKIRYTPGNGNWTVGTLERAVFALSATELGQSASWFNVEGSALPIANTLKVAYLNGSANTQWPRSPYTRDTYRAVFLDSYGGVGNNLCGNSRGSRPCFTLPSTFTATYYVDGNGALHDAQEYDQGGDFYDLLGNVVPSVKIATGSYVGTGTSGESTPNSLIAPFSPKAMFIVPGGSHAGYLVGIWLGGDRMSGQIGEVGANIGSNVMVEGNKISWYSTGGPWDQFNASPDAMGGAGFYYLIFG